MRARKALTLVELLVAVVIIIILIGLVVAFMPKREVRLVADGASQLETYLAGARTQALREQRPIGVRLITSDGGATFTELQLVVLADRFAPIGKLVMIDPMGDPNDPNNWTYDKYLDLPAGSLIQAANQNPGPVVGNVARLVGEPLLDNVEVGDMLEIVEVTESIHRVVAIDYNTNVVTLAASKERLPTGEWFVTGVPNVNCTAAAQLPHNYRFLRGPRALMGEVPYQLPKNVVISRAKSRNLPLDSRGNVEIRFAPGGAVLNARGIVILWLEDVNNVSKPRLIAIYSNGMIASHPSGPAGNEYQYVTDGRSSGQ